MEWKKIGYFALIVLWAMGVVGGVLTTIYCEVWPCVAGVVVAGLLSWDNVREMARRLTD
jgi:hypothetical protein